LGENEVKVVSVENTTDRVDSSFKNQTDTVGSPCYFCGLHMDEYSSGNPSDGFTEGKKAHLSCIKKKRDELKESVEFPDLGDKCHDPSED
jgi:hypothetical protein